jgi:hypothetical protein
MEEQNLGTIDPINDGAEGKEPEMGEEFDPTLLTDEEKDTMLIEHKTKVIPGLYKRAKTAEEKFKNVKPILDKPAEKIDINEELILKKIDEKVNERLEQKDLDSLSSSDELKKEIKNYAKLNGVSIGQASKSSYIQFRQEEDKARLGDAAINGTHKTMANRNIDDVNPEKDFDMSTKDGRDAYHQWHNEWKKTH